MFSALNKTISGSATGTDTLKLILKYIVNLGTRCSASEISKLYLANLLLLYTSFNMDDWLFKMILAAHLATHLEYDLFIHPTYYTSYLPPFRSSYLFLLIVSESWDSYSYQVKDL